MLGFSPIGSRPISGLIDSPIPETVFSTGQVGVLIYTLEVFSQSPDVRLISAATREFITLPTDALSNWAFHGTLVKALSYHRDVISGTAFNGVASGYSEIELENSSGEYDDVEPLTGYRVVCKAGILGSSFDTYVTLLDGFVEHSLTSQDVLRLTVSDKSSLLDVPAQPSIYAGTGGAEGGADLSKKRKPLAFGILLNVSPPLSDSVNLVYDLSSTQIFSVNEVRDRGAVLSIASPADYATRGALIAASVAPGAYATCLAEGKIRLGSLASEVTVDFDGAVGDVNHSGETIVRTAGQIARYLLELSGVQLDSGKFVDLDVLANDTVSYYVGVDSNISLRDAVSEVLGGVDAWGGLRRDGVFDVGRIDTPSDDAIAATYREIDVFDLKSLDLPSNIDPPLWRVRVPYDYNWTVQTDVSASTAPSTASRVASQYSLAEAIDEDVLTANSRAQDPDPRRSFYSGFDAASAEANRLLGLISGTHRRMFSVLLSTPAFSHDIGDVLKLYHSRLDLEDGLTVVVVGTRDDVSSSDETVELTVLG